MAHFNNSILACDDGTYGDCLLSCGNCFNDEVCNRRTGECPNGCQRGFSGFTCKTRRKRYLCLLILKC